MHRYSLAAVLSATLLCGCASSAAGPAVIAGAIAPSPKSVESRANALLARMTVEEKVGQIIQADIGSVTPEEVRRYNLGSVLNGGNSAPGGGKTAVPTDWIALADAYWTASRDTSDGGVGIPVLWGTDAVHGHNNLAEAVMFPHNIGLGAANDADLMRRIGTVTAAEVRATGIGWTFAPTLAVAQDDRWGRAYESYSENPEIVARYARAMVEGLQGKPGDADFLTGEHVIATAKHFVGDGGTQNGIDKGDTQGNVSDVIAFHGAGYRPAIDAGVQTIMSSYSSVNGTKMHGYRDLLTGVLRGQMGFTGFVIGDWNGHAEIPGCTATDCPDALMAGVDMYMAPDSWRGLYVSLLAQAKSGRLDAARLDEAVKRILMVKIRSGLFEAPMPSKTSGVLQGALGSDAHRALAREAVRESLVLLKNNNGILPLKPGQNVLVTGSGADSIQQQTGGWTLSWQGDSNSNAEFRAAQTIHAGLDEAMRAIGGSAVLSADGRYQQRPDAAVIIFGETPYAEYNGDRPDLVFENQDGANLKLLRDFKARNIPVIAVFLSGRPMWINPHLNAADAFVAAWLPGTEGGGLADVLVAGKGGAPRHDFTGRLSFSWPMKGDGQPVNGANAKGALFPLGYGLSYAAPATVGAVPEVSGVAAVPAFAGTLFARGDSPAGFAQFLGDSSNANIPVTSLTSKSLGGTVSTRRVDYKAQEDAREITWSGTGAGTYSIRANREIDLGAYKNGSYVITWKAEEIPSGPMMLSLACKEGCGGVFDASSLLRKTPANSWHTDRIALACLKSGTADFGTAGGVFALTSATPMKIAIHDIRLEKGGAAAPPKCSS